MLEISTDDLDPNIAVSAAALEAWGASDVGVDAGGLLAARHAHLRRLVRCPSSSRGPRDYRVGSTGPMPSRHAPTNIERPNPTLIATTAVRGGYLKAVVRTMYVSVIAEIAETGVYGW